MNRATRAVAARNAKARNEARIAEMEGVVREMRKRICGFLDDLDRTGVVNQKLLACPECRSFYGCNCHEVS